MAIKLEKKKLIYQNQNSRDEVSVANIVGNLLSLIINSLVHDIILCSLIVVQTTESYVNAIGKIHLYKHV